jgi:proton-dependent oligopeptide transporter, POT family
MTQNELNVPAASPAAPAVPDTHPRALLFFFWGEFAERSSYYGMRTVLALYLTSVLHFPDTTATPIYSAFKIACYFLPLLGGFIADRWLGRYWTIVGFSIPYVAGQFILSIPNEVTLFIALALLAGGSGVIKPNISTLMGQTYDQQRPGKSALRSAAFLWFYLSINIGALISSFAMPVLRDNFGYAVAFQFPAWLMVVALTVFAFGKPHYSLEKPGHKEKTPEQRREEWRVLVRLFGIFGLIVFFWVAYEQNDNLWVFFTRDYVDLHIPLLDRTIAPDQLQFINSLFVIILIPVFSVVFKKWDPDMRIFTPMRKIMAGFLLTATAAGLMSLAGFLVQGQTKQVMVDKVDAETQKTILDEATSKPVQEETTVSTTKISVLWIVFAYIILTVGEVLLYGTALELAYTAAPESMKGMVTAVFLTTSALGNFINMLWSPMYGGSLKDAIKDRGPLLPGQFFGITALVVVAASIAFYFVGRQFDRGAARDAAAAAT